MSAQVKPHRTLKQRVLFVIRLTGFAVIVLLVFVPLLIGGGFIVSATSGGCGGGEDPSAYGLAYEDVAFPSSQFNASIRAYFLPGDNGVTVIITPALTAGRGSRMHEMAILVRHGYNVLTYDSRNCIGQPNTMGYAETTEVGDALAYLAARPDIDAERIGVQGFSAGGAAAIMAGARFPALKSVVAEGNYHDFAVEIRDSITANGPLPLLLPYELGMRIAYRLITGYDLSVLSPISAIPKIYPRPIFLIYGSSEPALYGAHSMVAAAGGNAELWVVDGADHGNYVSVAPEAFERRLIGFYDSVYGITR